MKKILVCVLSWILLMPFPVFSQDGAEKFTGAVIFLKYYPDNQLPGAVEYFWKAIDWDVVEERFSKR